MYSEKGEGKSRLKEIAMLIFYAKRFLPSGTTIEAKPFRKIRICQQNMNALSTLADDEIVAHLEKSGAFWIKLSS